PGRAGPATPQGPRAEPRHLPATGGTDRTAQARKPAPHRNHTAAGTAAVVRCAQLLALIGGQSLPFSQRAPVDSKATAGAAGAQEVRGRVSQSDLAVGPDV